MREALVVRVLGPVCVSDMGVCVWKHPLTRDGEFGQFAWRRGCGSVFDVNRYSGPLLPAESLIQMLSIISLQVSIKCLYQSGSESSV